jgi:hypothetical protein
MSSSRFYVILWLLLSIPLALVPLTIAQTVPSNGCKCAVDDKGLCACKESCECGNLQPVLGARIGDKIAPDGKSEISIDMPSRLYKLNIGSPPPRFNGDPNSLGCCVWRALSNAAQWHHIPALYDIPEWMVAHHEAGGGWPDRVPILIKKICADRGAEVPEYIQVQGDDIEILKEACALGLYPCITYSKSWTGRYPGQQYIAHMLNLVHLNDRWAGIMDNNYVPNSKTYNIEWLSIQEFKATYSPGGQRGNGWSVIFLKPGPSLPPRN